MIAMKAKATKYNIQWDCPECGNSHSWWWDDMYEAFSEDVSVMKCDRCDAETWCQGDGHGFYEPVKDDKKRLDELESLELDLHNYVRRLEDKVNKETKSLYDAINSLAKQFSKFESDEIFDNLSRRVTEAELAIWRLENDVKPGKSAKSEHSFMDLIHEPKPPFHDRLREGCQLDGVSDETIAKIIRFVAVEVERMTERDMGGSFTVSNLEVARQLRSLAEIADIPF